MAPQNRHVPEQGLRMCAKQSLSCFWRNLLWFALSLSIHRQWLYLVSGSTCCLVLWGVGHFSGVVGAVVWSLAFFSRPDHGCPALWHCQTCTGLLVALPTYVALLFRLWGFTPTTALGACCSGQLRKVTPPSLQADASRQKLTPPPLQADLFFALASVVSLLASA